MTETPHDTNVPKIAICVATYQRPKGLAKLLNSLASLEVGDFQLHLIVADNDAEGSGKSAFDAATASFPFPATYVIEPTRGISSVRNRLVAEAFNLDAAYIAFVDDDETVDSAWIQHLLRTMIEENADVVGGPQIYCFDHVVAPVYRHCFSHRDSASGSFVRRVSTGNVLFKSSVLSGNNKPFNLHLNLIGGADSLLSAEILSQGHRLIWCAEAITYEHIPSERISAKWILRRQFRIGAGESLITIRLEPGLLGRMKRAAHGVGVTGLGSIRLLKALLFARSRRLQWLGMMAYGLGELVGAFFSTSVVRQYETIEGE